MVFLFVLHYLTLPFSIPLKGEKIMKESVNNCLLCHINTAAYTYACDIISNAPTFNTTIYPLRHADSFYPHSLPCSSIFL